MVLRQAVFECFQIAAVVFMAALLYAPPAAAQQACTEIGCTDGVTFTVDPAREWGQGVYRFSFIFDNRIVDCRGRLPLKPCEEGPSITCDAPGVTITESGCALPKASHGFGDIHVAGTPGRVMARVIYNNKLVVTRTVRPAYQQSTPNGPQCGPVCRSAVYDLFERK